MNFSKLTQYLNSLRETYGIPSVDCKVTRGYETLYRHSAGCSDPDGLRPVSDTDLYNIYSASKVITVTAAMQLCEQGRLKLEDRLDTYMPEFRDMLYKPDFPIGKFPVQWPTREDALVKAKNPIRVIDLFRMSAGFSYDMESAELQAYKARHQSGGTMQSAMEAIARMPLLYEPGTRWAYSLAHDVLAGLVERITGQRFGEYLRENIFDPLEIKDMYFSLDTAQQARVSAQYGADFDTHEIKLVNLPNRYKLTDTYESGGAGLICSVDAYSVFVQAMANGGVGRNGNRILTMESINRMRMNWLDDRMQKDFASTGKKGYGYGLGVRTLIDASASKSPVSEFGWDGAAGAFVLIDTQNQLGIFMAEHVLGFLKNYFVIHPKIRDLVYEAIG